MANFYQAYMITSVNEGGWTNGKVDKGGETYAGIARNYHPTWGGWAFLDRVTNKSWNQHFSELNGLVKEFYLSTFWNKYGLSAINNQNVANLVYDFKVQSKYAFREIQEVLNEMGATPRLVEDNIIGQKTINAINNMNSVTLANKIVEKRIKYLKDLANQGYFNSEWLVSMTERVNGYLVEVVDAVGKNQSSSV